MNLSKFTEIVNANNENQSNLKNISVEIALSEVSIGPTASVPIESLFLGFDWNAGKLLLYPKEDLVRASYANGNTIKMDDNGYFCRHCLTQVKRDDKYCPNCGKRFIKTKKA